MDQQDQIKEIKERNDIVAVISEYVPSLKRSGRNFFGLCPFHNEKTPSFSVNPEIGVYKCFGCGESGDVISFIQKIENYDFVTALEQLAKRVGITLIKKYSAQDSKLQKLKQRIVEANTLAAKFYNYILLSHPSGQAGRDYCKQRQIRLEEIKDFNLGYAPKGFHNLEQFLLKKGFTRNELIDWGLLVNKNAKIYDKFRARLMFPIFNHQGEVVGFSGRIIDKNDLGPKYLNSPETPVYKKSHILYGLYQAKEAIRKSNFCILVEGNIDIISSHKAGIKNIVAPLGTALTLDQLTLLKRYTPQIYFALDSDSAGEKALLRGIEMTEQLDIKTRVLSIGNYQDVDELIRNGENWPSLVKSPQTVLDHLLERFVKDFDLSSAEGKSAFADKILLYIAKLSKNIEVVHYLQKVASLLKIELSVLEKELQRIKSGKTTQKLAQLDQQQQKKYSQLNQQKYLLATLYQHKDFIKQIDVNQLTDAVTDYDLQTIVQHLFTDQVLNSQQNLLWEEICLLPVVIFNDQQKFVREINMLIKRLKDISLRKQIAQAALAGDDLSIINELSHKRKQILQK